MDSESISRFVPEHRRTNFKTRNMFGADELRRRREEAQVEIRKAKREEGLAKRRIPAPTHEGADSDSEDEDGMSAQGINSSNSEELQRLLAQIFSDSEEDHLAAATAFRKLLSKEKNPPIQMVIDSGIVPRLVLFLRSSNSMIQFESAWTLTNIASGDSTQTAAVVESGAVSSFVDLLSSPEHDVKEQAVWALGNIAGDSPHYRDIVLNAGALPPLLELLATTKKVSLLRNATWTLSNFCRGRDPQPKWEMIQAAIPTLTRLLYSVDNEVLADACWAVSYVSDGSNEKIQAVIDAGIPKRLVELLGHSNTVLQIPALRSTGNIVTGDDVQTQVVINSGALPKLLQLLSSPREAIRREACWTLSNVTAGNATQIQAVIDNNLIPPLINLMSTAEFKTKREACWAISNATSGAVHRPEQIRYLVSQGCIKPLSDLIGSHDNRVIQVALDGLENILRVGEAEKDQNNTNMNEYAMYVEEAGGLDAISAAQQNANEDIYKRAYGLIVKYFSDEGADAETGLEPQTADGMFGFGGQTQQPQGGFNF